MTPVHPLKRLLPKTLFARALLILIMPALLLQLLLVYLFYERHWDSVVRNMSNSFAGEIELLYRDYAMGAPFGLLEQKASMLGIRIQEPVSKDVVIDHREGERRHPEFFRQLDQRIQKPFMIQPYRSGSDIIITLLADRGIVQMIATQKRLISSTTYIFVLWSVGSSVVLILIATLFLRNQIRPIRQLAKAAERFGLGQEAADFRPSGAMEVRRAGRAFLVMQSRIQRQIKTRTEMLAGISHDLRTPLTRMKLQLAMLNLNEKHHKELQTDIGEMEHMITEYLQFARGQQPEATQQIELRQWLEEIVQNYQRQQQPVTFKPADEITIALRPNALRRALQNIIDNALLYGHKAKIELEEDGAYAVISVFDNGSGIEEERKEEAFKPFTRLDASRGQNTSGAGLGLSISRDIVQSHGGTIELRNRKKGLQVLISLPLHRLSEGGA